MLNVVTIAGRLVRDLELHHTQSGKAVCSFTLAVDRDFKNSNGEKEVDYIDCVAWNNTAEFITRYTQKGRLVIVSGRLQIREWKDKDGNKRRNAEVIASNVYFGDRKETTKQEQEQNFSQPAEDVGGFAEIDPADDGTLPF